MLFVDETALVVDSTEKSTSEWEIGKARGRRKLKVNMEISQVGGGAA